MTIDWSAAFLSGDKPSEEAGYYSYLLERVVEFIMFANLVRKPLKALPGLSAESSSTVGYCSYFLMSCYNCFIWTSLTLF